MNEEKTVSATLYERTQVRHERTVKRLVIALIISAILISEKTTFSPTDIETIKNLLSSMVKICEYVEMEESSEYSNRGSYRGNSYRNSYDDRSYDDGSYGRGRYAKRDRMGRYSSYPRDYSRGDFMEHLEEMAHKEPDERKRREYMDFIEKMNNM